MPASAYTVHPTQLGDVLVVCSDVGLVRLEVGGDHGPVIAELDAASTAPAVAQRPRGSEPGGAAAIVRTVVSQLDEYLAGDRTGFDVPLDWPPAGAMTRAAWDAILAIPYGETAGYGEVAMSAGRPRAARAVGAACRTVPFSIVVPVHRVIRADGSIGEYGSHPEVKRRLLRLEQEVSAARIPAP